MPSDWIGSGHKPYCHVECTAELTGQQIHWTSEGDWEWGYPAIDIRQSVADFQRHGPPDSEIPIELARQLAEHLHSGGPEPFWLNPVEGAWHLMRAAALGDWARVDELRGHINQLAPDGKTPAILALAHPPAVLQGLLERGANPDLAIMKGRTPLLIACEGSKAEHVRVLLRAGATPSLRDENGRRPLEEALSRGCAACVEALIEHGEQPGLKAIRCALAGGLLALAEEWFRRLVVQPDPYLFVDACIHGSLPIVRASLDAGIPPDRGLLEALRRNHRHQVIAELLANGANPNAADPWGKPALALAVMPDYRPMLLAAGADPDGRIEGYTLLYKLIGDAKPIEEIRGLLEAGADPGARQRYNELALHRAVVQGNPELIRLLLDHGASPSARDNSGRDAFAFARDPAILQLLQAHQPRESKPGEPQRV